PERLRSLRMSKPPESATTLLISRELGRSAPAGDELPSLYAAGERRMKLVLTLPQVGFARLLFEPSIVRNSTERRQRSSRTSSFSRTPRREGRQPGDALGFPVGGRRPWGDVMGPTLNENTGAGGSRIIGRLPPGPLGRSRCKPGARPRIGGGRQGVIAVDRACSVGFGLSRGEPGCTARNRD